MKATRVIIVDDEVLIVKAISAILRLAGYDIVGVASTVADALGLIGKHKIDIAIIDANLRGESAEPIFHRLAALNIDSLLISGYATGQLSPILTRFPFMNKPFDPASLLKILEEIKLRRA